MSWANVSSCILHGGPEGMSCYYTVRQVNKISLDLRHIGGECINRELMRSFHQATTISNWILNCLRCPHPNYTDHNCAGQPFQFHRWSARVLESVGAKEKQPSDYVLCFITKTQALWWILFTPHKQALIRVSSLYLLQHITLSLHSKCVQRLLIWRRDALQRLEWGFCRNRRAS